MQNSRTYFAPTLPKEFIYQYGVLCIHHRGRPVTPNPPFLDIFCSIDQIQKENKNPLLVFINKKVLHFLKISFLLIPRDRTKPPNAKGRTNANDPNVFATIMLLQAAAINRNNEDAV